METSCRSKRKGGGYRHLAQQQGAQREAGGCTGRRRGREDAVGWEEEGER